MDYHWDDEKAVIILDDEMSEFELADAQSERKLVEYVIGSMTKKFIIWLNFYVRGCNSIFNSAMPPWHNIVMKVKGIYLQSLFDWLKARSEPSKSAPVTAFSCILYNNHVNDTSGHW